MKFFSLLLKKENLLSYLTLLLSFLNVVFFHNKKIHLLYQIIICIGYFSLTTRKDRLIILLTFAHFSIMYLLTESLIMKLTNRKTLIYNSPYKFYNVPYWLISAYLCMVISVVTIYDFYENVL